MQPNLSVDQIVAEVVADIGNNRATKMDCAAMVARRYCQTQEDLEKAREKIARLSDSELDRQCRIYALMAAKARVAFSKGSGDALG